MRFCPTQNAHARNATFVTMAKSYCKKVFIEYENNRVLNVLTVYIYLTKHKNHIQNGNQVVFLTNDLRK
jgi:hypothetical protein